MDLRSYLLEAGVHPWEISKAEAEGPGAVRALAFERLLIPGERLTPQDVFEQTGFDPEFVRAMWRAMGFPTIPDDVAAFAPDDVEALTSVRAFLEGGIADEETILRMTRLISQAMARISDALVSQFRRSLALLSEESDIDDVEDLLPLGNLALRPVLEEEVVYLLRRHLVDAARRQLHSGVEGSPERQLAVGFVDLVRFTEVTQRIDEHQLEKLIDGFESTVSAVIAGVDGRVVKLIGDEVLFSTDDPSAAVDAGLALCEAFADDDVPDVRVGIAYGDVLVHQGDLFGPVVNLAHRAVGVATPGSVLVDEAIAEALADAEDLEITPIRARNLKGIGRTRLHRVREGLVDEGDDELVAEPDDDVEGPLALFGRHRRKALARLWRID